MKKQVQFALILLFLAVNAYPLVFTFNSTSDFDSGSKVNVSTSTDVYNQSDDTVKLTYAFADKDSSLVSYWRLERYDTSDETGLNDGGSPSGTVSLESCKLGGCRYFDGDNDYVPVSDSDSLSFVNASGDKPFSIVLWANSSNWIGTNGGLVSKYIASTGDREYLLWDANASSTITFALYTDYSNRISKRSAYLPENNSWVMITVTYDGSKSSDGIHIYFNDTNVDGATDYNYGTYTGMTNTAASLLIGAYGGASSYISFKGEIDDVKIYNRSLTLSEITELYNEGRMYKENGYWLSSSVSIPSDQKLANLTVNYSNADSNNYIDKIELINAADDSVLSTYNGDLNSSGTVVLTSSNFSNGFDQVTGVDLKVKVYFKGNSTSTPIINYVSGETAYYQPSTPAVQSQVVVSAPGMGLFEVFLLFAVSVLYLTWNSMTSASFKT